MINKAKNTTLKPDGKPALTPKLRFPEFRDTAGWKSKRLGELFSDRQESGLSGLPLLSLMDKEGIVPQENTNRKNNSNTDKSKYLRVVPGDIAYNTMRMWEGRSAYVGLEGLVSPAYTVCKPRAEVHSLLFSYYFKAPQLIEQFRRYSQGLVKDTLNLKYEAFSKITVLTPTYPEQQKIADCMSSVDELIAAHARKLNALKTHKKGLMQQLFTREGETQPRLRFPEFQDAGEWIEGKLINLSSEPLSNGVFNDPQKVGTGYKLINVSEMYIDTTIDEGRLSRLELSSSDFEANQVIHGDIFFTRSSLVKSGIAVSNIYLGSASDVTYDGHLIRFRPNTSKVVPLFAHYLFKTAPIRAHLIARGKSATMTTIGQADVASVTLFYPDKAEQQRIASCLSSLDALITAETQKLEALKTHKKGLMQQLFPSSEEVEA
jgi:type I restriction enzyme S subunit